MLRPKFDFWKLSASYTLMGQAIRKGHDTKLLMLQYPFPYMASILLGSGVAAGMGEEGRKVKSTFLPVADMSQCYCQGRLDWLLS